MDCVVFGYSNGRLKVLLIKRKPIANVSTEQVALPGDLVREDESLVYYIKQEGIRENKVFGSALTIIK